MNEPGTHIEIEDVLTSIRRLVSQDASSVRGAVMPRHVAAPVVEKPAVPVAEETAEETEEAPCLVLTPALRVEPGEGAPEGPVAAEEVEAPVVALSDADIVAELSRLESSIAEMEAAVVGHDVDFDAGFGGEDLPETVAPADSEPEAVVPPAEAVSAEPLPAEPRNDTEEIEAPFAEDVSPEDLDALLHDMAGEAGPEYEDEAADLIDEVIAADFVEAIEPPAEEAGLEAGDPVGDGSDPDLHDDAWTEDQGAMDWTEAAMSLAATAGQGPRRLHLSDALEEDRKPEILRSSYQSLRDEYERDEDLPGIEAALDDEPVMDAGLIDEEALRDLVAQLIREELRGVLGERITRNVRKLVRREIQRALMGEDFE